MPDTIRTFIAFAIPEHIKSFIRNLQNKLIPYEFQVRWVQPENVHLTLKFLGDVEKADIPQVAAALSASVKNHRQMTFRVKGLGAFPGIKRPRVLWAGLTGEIDRIVDYQKDLDEHLASIGFAKETRPFRGHLTIGRAKGKISAQKLLEAIKVFSELTSDPIIVDRAILYQSDLKPSGAIYTELGSVPFI